MKDGAQEFIQFLLKFYELHPDLKSRPLYLTGESYGGKYLPLFAHEIFAYNDEIK
jgi:carboxypeptidase C (cathepsin A)